MRSRSSHGVRAGRSRGFTLVEFLLALAVTAIVAAAVASMLFAARYGTATERTMRAATVQKKVVRHRLDAALRSARMVLARGPDCLVLWTAEQRDPKAPNLSELRRIEIDATGARLMHYRAPPGLPAEEDTRYELESTDFAAVTENLKGRARFPGEPWANGVSQWTTELDRADPYEARLVTYRLRVEAGRTAVTAASTAALRKRP